MFYEYVFGHTSYFKPVHHISIAHCSSKLIIVSPGMITLKLL